MKSRTLGTALLLAMVLGGPALAAPGPTDADLCSTAKADVRVAACTRLIRLSGLDSTNRASVFYDRAVGFTQLGAADPAIADYTEAIRLKPDLVQALNNRGALLRASGNPQKAIADFSEVLRMEPGHLSAFINRGLAFGDLGDYRDSIVDFTQAARMAPDQPEGYSGLCWARALEGREPEAAITDCNAALRLKPGDSAALGYQALAYLHLNDFDSAIVAYDQCIERQPKNASFLYGRGIAKLRAGNITGANEDMTSAKSIDPRIAQIFAGYGIAP